MYDASPRRGRAVILAVTFDLDGTLIDSTEAIVESFLHTFRALGEPAPPVEAIVRSIGYTLEQQFARFTARDPADCAQIYRAHYGLVACDKTHLMPGSVESLEQLRDAGLTLGFATSKKLVYAEMILEHLRVLHFFESRIGPDEVQHPKPHPEAVVKSLGRLHVRPDEMFFVGDTDFDVLAARDAGVRCLCVTTGYATRQELTALRPEAIFDTLADLTAYIVENRNEPS